MDPLISAQIATAAAQDLLFALAVGSVACTALFRQIGVTTPAAALRGLQFGTWGGLLLASLAALWLQTMLMSGASFAEAGQAVGTVLKQSHYGRAWLLSLMGLLLALRGSVGRPRSLFLGLLGACAYVAGRAAASHAADGGDFSVPEAVHTVHLLATALWAGCVISTACLCGRQGRLALVLRTPEQAAGFRIRLSQLASAALAVVVASGIYNAVHDTARVGGAWLTTGWGHLLAVKIVLVILALMLAALNRVENVPALRGLQRTGAQPEVALRRFDHWLIGEAVMMVMILAVAATLGHTAPDLSAN
jgi:copper resistance protein D